MTNNQIQKDNNYNIVVHFSKAAINKMKNSVKKTAFVDKSINAFLNQKKKRKRIATKVTLIF